MFLSYRAIGLSLAVVCGLTTTVQAQDPNVIVCDNCTTNARYAQAATNSFDDIPPFDIINGTKGVFVVNLNRDQNYYYEVTRSYDSPGSQPMIGDFFTTSARRVSAPTSQQRDIDDSLIVFRDLGSFTSGEVPASDLGDLGFDSALDLVGSGINQRTLQNVLTNRFQSEWTNIATGINDTVERLQNRYVGENDMIEGNSTTVVFEDGSTVVVDVVSIGRDIPSQSDLTIRYDVIEDSITIDGRRSAPQGSGDLGGFNFNTHNPNSMNNLTSLVDRFPGVNFTGGVSNTGSLGGGSNGNGGGSGGGGCFLLSCATVEEDPVCTLSAIPC